MRDDDTPSSHRVSRVGTNESKQCGLCGKGEMLAKHLL